MSDKSDKIIDTVDAISNIILLTLMMIQQITGKTEEEAWDMIKAEREKRKSLLKMLK